MRFIEKMADGVNISVNVTQRLFCLELNATGIQKGFFIHSIIMILGKLI